MLDPFCGSGTTGIAAALEGFSFVGVEQDERSALIAEARIAFWREHGEAAFEREAVRRVGERRRVEAAAAGQDSLF